MNKVRRLLSLFVLFVAVCLPLKSGAVINAKTSCPASGALAVSATSKRVVWAVIQAPFANAGTIYVGQSTVSSTTGVQLASGGTITLAAQGNSASYDLANVYFACSNSADAIVYAGAQ